MYSSHYNKSSQASACFSKVPVFFHFLRLLLPSLLLAFGLFASAEAANTSVKTLAVGKSYTISGYAEVTVSKTTVARGKEKSDGSYKITALKKGRATLRLYDEDGNLAEKVYLLVTNANSFQYDTTAVSLMAGETKTVTAIV